MRSIVVSLAALASLALQIGSAKADETLLGSTIAEAKKTDFFTFFHLAETSSSTDADTHTVVTFKPSAAKFHKLVTVTVTLDKDQHIQGMRLALARSFVDDRADGVFARDIAKSMLRATLSGDEAAKVADLINEIQYGQMGLVLHARELPKLPDTPTAGYQVYLGKKDRFEQNLGGVKLELLQQKHDDEEQVEIGVTAAK